MFGLYHLTLPFNDVRGAPNVSGLNRLRINIHQIKARIVRNIRAIAKICNTDLANFELKWRVHDILDVPLILIN